MKIACLQTSVLKNKQDVLKHIFYALKESCEIYSPDFILLPNNFLSLSQGIVYTKQDVSELFEMFSSIAKQFKTYIITGTINYSNSEPANAYIINNEGFVINGDFVFEEDAYVVFDTEFGKIAVVLEENFWIVENTRIFCLKGAEVIFVPGEPWNKEVEVKKASIWGISALNCVLVAYCSYRSKNTATTTKSIIASPYEIIKESEELEKLLFTEIENDLIQSIREPDLSLKKTLWWVLYNRNPKMYHELINANQPVVE